jgi:hypothetical protein
VRVAGHFLVDGLAQGVEEKGFGQGACCLLSGQPISAARSEGAQKKDREQHAGQEQGHEQAQVVGSHGPAANLGKP